MDPETDPTTPPVAEPPAVDPRDTTIADLQRTNAMLMAGIDLSTPVGKLFRDGYRGELSDVEAVKTAAREVGALPPESTPPPSTDPTLERLEGEPDAAAIRNSLVTPGDATPPPPADPYQMILAKAARDEEAGLTRDQIHAEAFHGLVTAAASGDARVIVGS